MFHFENAYHIPNSFVEAWSCRTNLPSNTAFRGFGGPQGMFAGEHIIRHVARVLAKDVTEIGMNRILSIPTQNENIYKNFVSIFS